MPIVAGFAFSLAIGASLAAGRGWRLPYAALSAVIAAATVIIASGVHLPEATRHTTFTLRHFADRTVWAPWVKIVNLVLAEFTVGIWAVTYLREVGGASPGAAPVLAMVFGLALFAVRMVTDRLQRTLGGWSIPVSLVVLGGAVAGLCVVEPLWARVTFLAVAGVGAGPLYPLSVDRFYAAAEHALDSVGLGAYCALASGAGVLIGPLLVGVAADAVGLRRAILLVPVLALIGIVTQSPRRA